MYGKEKQSGKFTGLDVFVLILCAMTIFYVGKTYQYRQRQMDQVLSENESVTRQYVKEEQQAAQQEMQQAAQQEVQRAAQQEVQQGPQLEADGNTREETVSVQTMIPETIRVLLTAEDGGYFHQAVSVEGRQELHLSGAVEAVTAPGEAYTFTDQLQVGESVMIQSGDGKIGVSTLSRACGTPWYEGSLHIERQAEGLLLINEVDLETYLKYVVPSEMPSSWPLEALKAQAICARTYAVHQISSGSLADYHADVDDTVSYQVYHNLSRQDSTDRAVEETAARILTYEGAAIPAYFFSTSWGRTSTDEVWSLDTSSDYLRSVSLSSEVVETLARGNNENTEGNTTPAVWSEEEIRAALLHVDGDDYEAGDSWYRWQITFTGEELQQKFQSLAPEAGALTGLEVEARSDGGAVIELRLIGERGSYLIEEEYGVREFFSPGEEPICLQNGEENRTMELLPSAYIIWDTTFDEGRITSLTIYGGGYGHGVGMSQSGAKHMAESGMNCESILQVFYQNVRLG